MGVPCGGTLWWLPCSECGLVVWETKARERTPECAQLQGSYPVARLKDEYLPVRATQGQMGTAKRALVSRSTRRACQKGAKCPFRILQICQLESENAKSGSGRLGAGGDVSTGAA